jgi:hypothetical protein
VEVVVAYFIVLLAIFMLGARKTTKSFVRIPTYGPRFYSEPPKYDARGHPLDRDVRQSEVDCASASNRLLSSSVHTELTFYRNSHRFL